MGKKYAKKFRINTDNMTINMKVDKINRNIDKAQFWLDSQIMTDMVPLMPMNTGDFINITRTQSAALAGSGRVIAGAAPTGRFLYEGKVMVDPETGSPWARKGAKKVVTDRPLTYSNPNARPEWFEVAKKDHLKEWEYGVGKEWENG